MDPLAAKVLTFSRRYGLFRSGETLIVGVSGGANSLCLLEVLRELAVGLPLRLVVAHLHHGLRGVEADEDARAVMAFAAERGLPSIVKQVDVRALAGEQGLSLEEAARQARYAFLADTARRQGATSIAVGHHADDQAETVLMHFLRGSGVSGLRGMLPRGPLSDYRLPRLFEAESDDPAPCWLVRPLLCATHVETLAYCEAHGLQPRYDRSNEDTTLFRNRLRHELMPVLESYNPAIRAALAHTAEIMAGDGEVIQAELEEAWDEVVSHLSPDEVRLHLARWRALPIGLQRATLREAIRSLRRSLRNVNWEHTEHALWLAREGATGQRATLTAGLELEIGYDTLRIAPAGSVHPTDLPQLVGEIELAAPGVTEVGEGWRVVVRRAEPGQTLPHGEPWAAWLDAAATGPVLWLRPRQPGDRFQPQGMGGHSMKLNEFMINSRVSRHVRAGWPMLVGREGIAWVCGLRVDQRAAVTSATEAIWQVRFERA